MPFGAGQTHMGASAALRVLIVEDEPIIALDLELMLRDAGHAVVGVAATEEGAADLALRERPDLILLDLRLANGGRGHVVAERVAGLMPIEIICASATLDPGIRQRLAPLDPVAIIDKPYLEAQLLRAVEMAARRVRPRDRQSDPRRHAPSGVEDPSYR